MATHGHRLTRPICPADLANPLQQVDSIGGLGGDIRGWQVLCLAAGGGKHGPLFAAAGAHVTVLDFSSAMLDKDRYARDQWGLSFQIVEGSMDNLSMFGNAQFDLVVHPVSTCYLADPLPVFSEVARVTKPQGLYISQHKTPQSLQVGISPQSGRYLINHPYYSDQPLPPSTHTNLVREPGTEEYIHRLETLLGGICRSGFVIEDLREPLHADPNGSTGSFEHRSLFVPPYVRLKARRVGTMPTQPLFRAASKFH